MTQPTWTHGMTEAEWVKYRPLDTDALLAEPVLRATHHTTDYESIDVTEPQPRSLLDRIKQLLRRG